MGGGARVVQTWTALTSERWPPALCARALAASRYAWLRLRPVARRLTFSQVVSCVASSYVACRTRMHYSSRQLDMMKEHLPRLSGASGEEVWSLSRSVGRHCDDACQGTAVHALLRML